MANKTENQKYWKKVLDAYSTVAKAKGRGDFQRWLVANKDGLEFNYDQYADGEYQSYQMPMAFDDWAFDNWLANGSWNDEE